MNHFRRLRFSLIALLAVLCLLGLQYAAAKHGLLHLAADKSSEQQKHSPHEKTCDKCVVYAEIGDSAPTSAHAIRADVARAVGVVFSTQQPVFFRQPSVYFARGPPHSV